MRFTDDREQTEMFWLTVGALIFVLGVIITANWYGCHYYGVC